MLAVLGPAPMKLARLVWDISASMRSITPPCRCRLLQTNTMLQPLVCCQAGKLSNGNLPWSQKLCQQGALSPRGCHCFAAAWGSQETRCTHWRACRSVMHYVDGGCTPWQHRDNAGCNNRMVQRLSGRTGCEHILYFTYCMHWNLLTEGHRDGCAGVAPHPANMRVRVRVTRRQGCDYVASCSATASY